jgi:glycosyltransferase involved in cell wall biosynthesis
MRIAVISPPWLAVPPTGYGGTELVLDSLCRGLAALGHDVLLCTTADSTCPVERHATYERHLGVANINPADELRHVMDAYDAAQQWGADVIHDHTVTGPIWALTGSQAPVVTTNHGPFDEPLRSIYRRVAASVPVIAISHDQASRACDVPVYRVIHHGIDTAALQVGDGGGEYALFLGRMNESKGVHTAIEVARAAGIPLKIAAKLREPLEMEYFRTRVEPLLGGDVEYLGEAGPTEKVALLRDAACLLNPIAWPEPFGLVMIEALACGTPVVATPCGAAPEIVDDGVTGHLRSIPDGLVDALRRVDTIDRSACRAVVEERFSMERMAADHVAAYRDLLGGSHRSNDASPGRVPAQNDPDRTDPRRGGRLVAA